MHLKIYTSQISILWGYWLYFSLVLHQKVPHSRNTCKIETCIYFLYSTNHLPHFLVDTRLALSFLAGSSNPFRPSKLMNSNLLRGPLFLYTNSYAFGWLCSKQSFVSDIHDKIKFCITMFLKCTARHLHNE